MWVPTRKQNRDDCIIYEKGTAKLDRHYKLLNYRKGGKEKLPFIV